jgi:hypothetical protein
MLHPYGWAECKNKQVLEKMNIPVNMKGGMVCGILYHIKCGHSFVITYYHIDKSNKTLPLALA